MIGANAACVSRSYAAAIACVQLDPPRHLGSIRVGPMPTSVVSGPLGRRAYVTNQFSDEIGVIDLAQQRQTATIRVPGNPLAAALAPDGRTLYVTTNFDRLCAVWLDGARVAATVPIPQACAHLALHPSGRWLYVPTWKAGVILEMDRASLRTLRTFTVGGVVQEVAVSADGAMLYAANEQGWLDVIHLGTGRQAARVPLPAPAFALARSHNDATVYVGLVTAGRVAVVDRRTLAVTATVRTGGRPRGMALDASGRTLVVANEEGWVDFVR
jgi:YVTN family beta-propeller protein